MPKQEITLISIAESIEELARMTKSGFDAVDKRFDAVESRLDRVETDVSQLKSDVSQLKSDVSQLKSDVGYLKSQMVTKEYLDDKLADLRGDFIALLRKEDQRLSGLISLLKERALIGIAEVKQLALLQPLIPIG